MLKVNAFAISTQVVHLEALLDRAVYVLVVPLVGIDFLAVLVFERPIPRRVLCASPLSTAILCL
jgi:hypothetical protein